MRVLLLALTVGLGLILAGGPQPAQAAISSHYASLGGQRVAPGVVHDWGTVSASAGRQAVNVVQVDPFQSGINLRTSLAHDRVTARQRTTDQAYAYSREARRVVATINGATFGSWPMGHVAARGLNVRDGEVLTVGRVQAGSGPILGFGIDANGRARLGTPAFEIGVTLLDGSVGRIDRINQGRSTNEAVLFTPRFGTHTWTDTNGDEYVIEGVDLPLRPRGGYTGTVTQVRRGLGDTPIGRGQLVLSATGTAADAFKAMAVGDQVSIRLSIEDGWQDIVHAVGGRELLVRDGSVEIRPYRNVTVVNPRSAVGITRDGKILMVTVDGRSTDSGGVSLEELADLMMERGAVHALNLDGGGSTTLAVRRPGDVESSIVNRPSDGSERTVATTLQVVSTIPTGELDKLLLAPESATLHVGQTQQYSVKGHDAAYNGIVIDTADVNWTVTDDAATVDANAVLTARLPGDHTVTARTAGVEDSAGLTILADTTPPVVSAPLVTLRGGVGMSQTAAPLRISWTASDDIGTVSSVELHRRVDGGTWQSVTLSSATPSHGYSKVGLGRTIQFRVRATDSAGNRSKWVLSRTMRVGLYNEFDPAVTLSAGWWAVSLSDAIGGQLARATTLSETAGLSYSGVQVAWVGQRGPKHGFADVYVDGTLMTRVDLYNSTRQPRRVLFVSLPADLSATTPSATIDLYHAGTSTRPRVDVDAFLVLSTVD